MTLTPEEFERMQYTRVSAIGLDLIPTGNEEYPFRVEKHGVIVRDELRNAQDVSNWVDHQEDEEAAARARFGDGEVGDS